MVQQMWEKTNWDLSEITKYVILASPFRTLRIYMHALQ